MSQWKNYLGTVSDELQWMVSGGGGRGGVRVGRGGLSCFYGLPILALIFHSGKSIYLFGLIHLRIFTVKKQKKKKKNKKKTKKKQKKKTHR